MLFWVTPLSCGYFTLSVQLPRCLLCPRGHVRIADEAEAWIICNASLLAYKINKEAEGRVIHLVLTFVGCTSDHSLVLETDREFLYDWVDASRCVKEG